MKNNIEDIMNRAIITDEELKDLNPKLPIDIALILKLGEKGVPLKNNRSYFTPELDTDNYIIDMYNNPINLSLVYEWRKK